MASPFGCGDVHPAGGGLALLALAVTRKSGMDEPGRRVSSVSVQIVGSVLITGGLLLLAHSGYVIWQVVPGLNVSASWAVQGRMSALLWALRVWPCSHSTVAGPASDHRSALKPAGSDRRPPAPPKR